MKEIPTVRIAGRTACILIVDDELQNRQLLEVMLQAAGHRTLCAVSGEEALAMIVQEQPDLILLDIIMPGLDGFQVAAQLKGNPSTENIPIIMITALQERSATILGLKAGAEEFITRPIDHIELCLRVKNLLRLKEGTAELNRVNDELHKLVDEKDVLLRELHHRVKNNLQIVSSILSLQSNFIKDPQLLDIFHESQARIKSIALIHELLYKKGHMDRIDFKDYLENLVENIFKTIGANTDRLSYTLACDSALMDPDSVIHCGLIVNELITNSIKYAFPEGRKGTITISLRVHDETCVLTVADNGIGLPPDQQIKTSRTMGLQLVDTLVRQIGATIQMGRGEGTSYAFTFPFSHVNGENK